MNTELCADHKWLAGSNVRTCGGCLARERATLLDALRNQGLLQNTANGVILARSRLPSLVRLRGVQLPLPGCARSVLPGWHGAIRLAGD